MLLIVLALLQASPSRPSDAEVLAAEKSLAYYSLIERFAVASEDIRICGELGYESHMASFQNDLAETVWRPRDQVEPTPFPEFIERFNATLRRVREEDDAEAAHAATSKAAFDIFQRNISKRCEALAHDHPLWLEKTRTTMVNWVVTWDQIEQQMLGTDSVF